MSSSTDISRLHSLTSRLCDGEISAQELDELAAILADNKQSIDEYLEHTSLHLAVSERLRESRWDGDHVGERITPSDSKAPRALSNWLAGKGVIRRLSLLVLAASLIVAAVFAFRYGPLGTPDTARITEAIDCDWGEQHWGTPKSASLVAGQEVKLDSGLMVINFGDGAEVTLEAPVHFTVLAKDRGQLNFGKLTAYVPEKAHGFTVVLPQANIVDLGTRFGAIVSEDGTSETHVFQGKVLIESLHGEMKDRDWTLAAGAALRLGVDWNDVKQFAAKPRSFVTLDFADPTETIASPMIGIPSDSRLILWLDAARRLQLDEVGRVVSWGDASPGDGGTENNAWQVKVKQRPLWVRDAINHRSAVRFDGSSYLVTTPMSSGDNATIICVFRHRALREAGDILNLNGSRSLVLRTRDHNLIGEIVSTTGGLSRTLGGILKMPLPDDNAAVVAAYVYDRSENRSSMYFNGAPVAESQASSSVAVRSPKFIGASISNENFFKGDLCELLLFDSSLTSENCAQVSADLMRKYGIVKVEREPRILARPAQSVQ